jgi:predicted MPP superfamily phosphohydrolase
MKGFGDKPLYWLFLLSEKIGDWPAWKLVPFPLLMVAGAAWLWAGAGGRPPEAAAVGWALALLLLVFSAADLALFSALPRRGLSFGPVPPPWLVMAGLRCALALAALPLVTRWPVPALLGMVIVQACVWALMAYGTLVEPFRLQVRHVELPSAKLSNPGTPLRIVHLSDLHVERLTRREQDLPALVAGLKPDLIVLTGDYLNTSFRRDPRALSDLRTLLLQLHAPGGIVAIWGTPQVDFPDVLRPVLAGVGIVLLEDEAREVVVRDHRLWLIGLATYRDLKLGGARLRELSACAPPGAYTILLHHTPDLMPQAAALGVDLVLAGHTHGGQWRLPWFGALHTSSRFWKRYESGHHQEGTTHLYVSRGLGMEGYGVPRARFFCPPEVVSITIAADKQSMSPLVVRAANQGAKP